MPATRRKRTSDGPTAKGGQSTLSFGPRTANNRVTKSAAATATAASKDARKKADLLGAAPGAVDDVVTEQQLPDTADAVGEAAGTTDVGHVATAQAVAREAARETGHMPRAVGETKAEEEARRLAGGEQARAEKVTDAQVNRYWRAKEAERRAPRVHQQDLSTGEKVLRLFDISSQYGPCVGITRKRRWARANKLGLKPPIEVLAVLLKEEKKGNSRIEVAHVDELMSSTSVVG